METMYLRNGREVSPLRKVEGGWLYQLAFLDEYGEDSFIDDDVTYFTEELFEKPPVEIMHVEVTDLQAQIQELKDQKTDLLRINRETMALAADIPNYDFIQMLVDYMRGDFNFILYENNYEIFSKEKICISSYVKVISSKSGFQLYKLHSENYDSYDDKPIRIFINREDAVEWAAKKAITKLKEGIRGKYPWSKKQVESWFKGIHHSSKVREHPEVKREYQTALKLTDIRDSQIAKEKLEKEIAEKKEKLEKLGK